MKIIKPAEISGKICSIIDDADKELILISPYINFKYWAKLLARLNKAIERGIKVTFFVRKDVDEHKGLHDLNVEIIYVELLHAKIYMNENQAILTSMNLIEASDKASIDFGVITENVEELDEVKNTYLKFILKNLKQEKKTTRHHEKNELNENPIEPKITVPISEPNFEQVKKVFFETFQKSYPNQELHYNNSEKIYSCNNFPFQWTNFEYSGIIKIKLNLNNGFDFRNFRHDNIEEFKSLLHNHKTFWPNPHNLIWIYGDAELNGIAEDDLVASATYQLSVLRMVIQFLKSKENAIFNFRSY